MCGVCVWVRFIGVGCSGVGWRFVCGGGVVCVYVGACVRACLSVYMGMCTVTQACVYLALKVDAIRFYFRRL